MPGFGFAIGFSIFRGDGARIAPAGFTRSTIDGVPVTYLGRPVYDDGSDVIYL